MTTRAQKIWDTYTNGYSELLCTPVEDFDSSLDEGIKKILASVIREISDRFATDWGELQHPCDILNEIADELENLK